MALVIMLFRRFVEVMTEYNRIQVEYREQSKNKIKRQLEIDIILGDLNAAETEVKRSEERLAEWEQDLEELQDFVCCRTLEQIAMTWSRGFVCDTETRRDACGRAASE